MYSLDDLLLFLDSAPTAWHAVEIAITKLKKHGFKELKESEAWSLEPAGKYYIHRAGAALCAFINSIEDPQGTSLVASHVDSPSLKLKPRSEIRKQNMILLGVEVYGSPLLSSWLNRDLGVAGQVSYENKQGDYQTTLVNLFKHPVTIPQLAIHLDREVNEKGLLLNRQEHLNALATLSSQRFSSGSYLEFLLKDQIDFKQIISSDLFLYPLEKAKYIGYEQEMIASYRLDSLASVHAALEALVQNPQAQKNQIKMGAFWNHEEVGSLSTEGASSPFVTSVIERVLLAHRKSREAYFQHLSQSFCVSVDLAHAWHPNYADKHDSQHQPLMGEGVVVKNNAQQRYATSSRSMLPIYKAATQSHQTLQQFVSRNDISSGTTIGPIHAGQSGMSTVDIGCGQLSMHSCRELMSCLDQKYLFELLSKIYE